MINKLIRNSSKEYIQAVAEYRINRRLTPEEYADVCEAIDIDLEVIVSEEIDTLVYFNKIFGQNNNFDKKFPHYKVFLRRTHIFPIEIKLCGVFKNEREARCCVDLYNSINPHDEWRVVRVDVPGNEKEIYKVNC